MVVLSTGRACAPCWRTGSGSVPWLCRRDPARRLSLWEMGEWRVGPEAPLATCSCSILWWLCWCGCCGVWVLLLGCAWLCACGEGRFATT
eukprot:scaffold102144_cov24-Tisochrysis_lutea.AAC.7